MKINIRPSAKKSGSKSPTTATRKALAAKGQAMPDNSFPVPNLDFLKRAIRSLGRTPPEKRAKVVAFLRRRAKALGATDLLKKGALAMSADNLLDNALLLSAIHESLELAGAAPTFGADSDADNAPAVKKAKKKLGLKSKAGMTAYAKLRKKGLPHHVALAAAKKKEHSLQVDEMSNNPKV